METVIPSTRTLGVTGGIGSGKTAVCDIMNSLGAPVFSADLVARQIMTENQSVRKEIIAAFGSKSYNEDNSLNRPYLAQQVFGDNEKVATINSIVHPRVHDAFNEQKRKAEQEAIPILVYEAALIFETGGEKRLDAVVVVYTPLELRIQRVMQRDNVTREQVEARMHHQLSAEDLLKRADYVIENDGTLEVLTTRVTVLYKRLLNSNKWRQEV